ncbi:MAG: hypothetical protein JST84_02640 [Acidobacteria bacterium]|nr:hypothetical protein [Acidobacteriota bacterium]
MKEIEREEFYIGYLPQAPRTQGRLIRKLCFALLGIVVAVALLLIFGLQKLPLSVFEFGQHRQFTGVVQARPYPTLLVRDGNSLTQYLLVAEGKHGADVAKFDGKPVTLKGSRIYRDGLTMVEVVRDSVQVMNDVIVTSLPTNDLGTFTLVGEIVDSKCYLGVMNPGNTKPHRECAALCISGGIPPMFIARDLVGNKVALQLVSANGTAVNQEVLAMVAEPIEITGQVVQEGEQLIFKADPKTYRRK